MQIFEKVRRFVLVHVEVSVGAGTEVELDMEALVRVGVHARILVEHDDYLREIVELRPRAQVVESVAPLGVVVVLEQLAVLEHGEQRVDVTLAGEVEACAHVATRRRDALRVVRIELIDQRLLAVPYARQVALQVGAYLAQQGRHDALRDLELLLLRDAVLLVDYDVGELLAALVEIVVVFKVENVSFLRAQFEQKKK